ncbi:MAG: O-antigen ligase family protein [Chloroflexota bacterium]
MSATIHPTSRTMPERWRAATEPASLAAGGLALGVGILAGLAVAASIWAALAWSLGIVAVWLVLARPPFAIHALILITTLLPFGVIPLDVGLRPTLVDLALFAIIASWAWHAGVQGEKTIAGLGVKLVVLFAGVVIVAASLGTAVASPSGRAIREVTTYALVVLSSVATARIALNLSFTVAIIRTLICASACSAALGIAIWSLPPYTTIDVLSVLSPIGYPTGRDVLRYLPAPNNTYSETLRATGTSIDPNVFGGMLMLGATAALAQVASARPVLPRLVLGLTIALTASAMYLSHSRSSWLGLAAAAALTASVSCRRLWLAAPPAVLALMATGIGRDIVARLVSGFTLQDRAAALRLDEYRQALSLIARYPVFGVGFFGSPELGTFVGVSSIYLTVAEHAGLIGLTSFLAVVAWACWCVVARWRHEPGLAPLAMTTLAMLAAILVAGAFDHYFVNPAFMHMVALLWTVLGIMLGTAQASSADRAPTPQK